MGLFQDLVQSSLTGGGTKTTGDPLRKQRDKKKPKKPKKTAEEVALQARQKSMLDKEIEESEEKFSALARNKLGRQSLLSGAPRTSSEASGGSRSGGAGGAGSLGARGGAGVALSRSGTGGTRGGSILDRSVRP